jgi:hypothetical protein
MIRNDFPPANSTYEGGVSDGWQYQVKFTGSHLQASLDMVRSFLAEEGYADIPIPETADDLKLFKLPTKQQQILLFGDNGYVHNPIKILFDPTEKQPKKLILCLFNEAVAQHLLKFHGKIPV